MCYKFLKNVGNQSSKYGKTCSFNHAKHMNVRFEYVYSATARSFNHAKHMNVRFEYVYSATARTRNKQVMLLQ